MKQPRYLFRTDTNEFVKLTNIAEWCRINGYRPNAIYDVLSGARRSYMGWQSLPAVVTNIYQLQSPYYRKYSFSNINKFARTHGLDPSNVWKVLNGLAYSVSGWTLPKSYKP